jgi:hypothetical protein
MNYLEIANEVLNLHEGYKKVINSFLTDYKKLLN